MATVNIAHKDKVVEELKEIVEENPNLYEALAKDDRTLIRK
jgi:hypothetical protein